MRVPKRAMASFFGIEVSPGEPAYYRPDDECPAVRVKVATLLLPADGGDLPDGARIVVRCRVAKGARAGIRFFPLARESSRVSSHRRRRLSSRASIPAADA